MFPGDNLKLTSDVVNGITQHNRNVYSQTRYDKESLVNDKNKSNRSAIALLT